jgi:hypothetical protein
MLFRGNFCAAQSGNNQATLAAVSSYKCHVFDRYTITLKMPNSRKIPTRVRQGVFVRQTAPVFGGITVG